MVCDFSGCNQFEVCYIQVACDVVEVTFLSSAHDLKHTIISQYTQCVHIMNIHFKLKVSKFNVPNVK